MKKTASSPKPAPPVHPITLKTAELLELKPEKRYLLFIDSKNLCYESAQDLATAMKRHEYNVSIILTDGDPHVVAIESDAIKDLTPGSTKVEPREET